MLRYIYEYSHKNIDENLNKINEDFKSIYKKIKNLLDSNDINNNNDLNNFNEIRGKLDNKLNTVNNKEDLKNKKLLENIRSKIIINKIFINLNEKIKLKLIKYNNTLQNKININLINYKFFSGRYIIYITKGKGKEYNGYNDDLIFEGEYLNGVRNGKGKRI